MQASRHARHSWRRPCVLTGGVATQELNLSWNVVRPKGGIAIAQGASAHARLQVLDISWCGVQDKGAEAFGACCETNQVLPCGGSGVHAGFSSHVGGRPAAAANGLLRLLHDWRLTSYRTYHDSPGRHGPTSALVVQ